MIDCIFTIDYEIYGNGEGALEELVYAPTQKMIGIFEKHRVPFVAFVEVAEFEMIELAGTDPAVASVKRQIREMHRSGIEIALHLHPQWYHAKHSNGTWLLDYNEYNLCTLKPERIEQIVDQALAYLAEAVGEPNFRPLSFRAGNWLFQPTKNAAAVLARKGVRLDSSVFKGGRQRNVQLDYRSAPKDAYYWRFNSDATVPEANGVWLEIPTYSVMVPCWKMLTGKRLKMQRKSPTTSRTRGQKLNRYLDLLRPRYPLKFDFCRMTLAEMTTMIDRVIREDRKNPGAYRPMVAIGHSKDLVDFEAIDAVLAYLKQNNIRVTTLREAYARCLNGASPRPASQPMGAVR
jgi:hypothetical protein